MLTVARAKSSRVVVLFESCGICMSHQKTLFELFRARGGGGLAPESPTVNEGAVAS